MTRPAVLAPIAVLVAIIGVAIAANALRKPDKPPPAPKPPIVPAEYLYLDNARVAAYLAQERDGTVGTLTRSLKETGKVEAKVKGGEAAEVGASSQLERFVEESVTPTMTSSFTALLRELKASKAVPAHTAKGPSAPNTLEEGAFLWFETDRLRQPRYSDPYVIAREAATLRALFPRSGKARKAAQRFAKEVGPNPRVTLSVRGTGQARYLLPTQYEGLTDERSLFGGRHTILAKVVRVFGGAQRGSDFVDAPTREVWRYPLARAPSSLLRRIRTCRKKRDSAGDISRCLRRTLRRQTAVKAPGAVLIPIAIYKSTERP